MEDLKILVVDDESRMRKLVKDFLVKDGYLVVEAEDGQQALDIFYEDKEISLIILDVMMPKRDGWEVCREIRANSKVPIIMLTAKTQEESILNGLHIGADDYVTKPFSVKQLYARMEAVMRRASDERKALTGLLSWEDDLVIDFEEASARKKGAPLSLTKSEWKILSAMASYPKKVFARDELMEIAFGGDADSFDRVIDTHIKNLRKKVESDPRNPVYIKTVHGLGYKFGGDEN